MSLRKHHLSHLTFAFAQPSNMCPEMGPVTQANPGAFYQLRELPMLHVETRGKPRHAQRDAGESTLRGLGWGGNPQAPGPRGYKQRN